MSMHFTARLTTLTLALTLLCAFTLPGCGGDQPKTDGGTKKDHGHDHDHDHDHDHGHGGKAVSLGEGAYGPYKIVAAREEGAIKAGGDAGFDLTITAANADAPKVASVRVWVGVEDGKGSLKAKADSEAPKHPDGWHAHAEVPDPVPAGAKFWIEIEDDKGATTKASFELKG